MAKREMNGICTPRASSRRLAPRRDHEPVDPDELRRRLPEYLSHEDYYRDMVAAGYQFGPNFKLLQNVWRKTGEMLGEIVVPEQSGRPKGQLLPASDGDGCLLSAVQGARPHPHVAMISSCRPRYVAFALQA